MHNESAKKYGNRRTSRPPSRGRARRAACVKDHRLDADIAADYAALVAACKGDAPRALYDAAEGYQHPHRWLWRRLVEAWMTDVPLETAERPLLRILEHLKKLYAARQAAEQHDDTVRRTA